MQQNADRAELLEFNLNGLAIGSKLISKKILQILNFKKIDLVNKFYDIKFK